jgi:methionyl-tRNA formyltransferase
MKFAILGFDLYLGVFEAFLAAGWTPVKAFAWPVDGVVDRNKGFEELARSHKIPIQLSRIHNDDYKDLANLGCEVLICSGYPWKIGDWSYRLPYAINFHPSPLPEGRGPYPFVRAILEGRKQWGATCHKIAPEFDTGDILAQDLFPISENICHEQIMLQTQMNTRKLAQRVAGDFVNMWERAKPQLDGTYWNRWTDDERTIKFEDDVNTIMRTVRAFGKLECIAYVRGIKAFVRHAVAWEEFHNHPPGTLVHKHHRMMIIAAKDGYVGLVQYSYIDPLYISEIGR